MIHIRISCLLESCKRQGLSVLDGKIGKDLHLQNCQQLAKLQVWNRGAGPLQTQEQGTNPVPAEQVLWSITSSASFSQALLKRGKKLLLLVGYPSGRCASFALASREFLSTGEHLRFLDSFLKLGLHSSGFPASLLCVALSDCKRFRAGSLLYYVQHLAPQSPLDDAVKSPATYQQGQREM